MWIESHQEVGAHPKTRKAARLLGVSRPAVVGHLHYLWWWALDYAQSGDLSGFDPGDLADAALWDGDPAAFIEALIGCGLPGKAGFLEYDAAGRLLIHDWDEYAGRLIRQRQQAKARTRAWRDGHRTEPPAPGTPAATPTPAPVTHNVGARYASTVPNQTVPDLAANAATPAPAREEPAGDGEGATATRRIRPVPKPAEREKSATERHPLFPPLVALFGRPAGAQWGVYTAQIKALEELAATPEEIPRRAETYRAVMGTDAAGKAILLTLPALVKHWHICGTAPPPPKEQPNGLRPHRGREPASDAAIRAFDREYNGHRHPDPAGPGLPAVQGPALDGASLDAGHGQRDGRPAGALRLHGGA